MFWSFSFAPCFQRTHRCKKYTGFSQCLNVKIPFGPSSLERASHFSNRLTYIIAIHLRFLDFKIDVCCLNAVQLSSVSFRPSADYVVCLLCSIGDAVALILCPRGTADMDESKLLTWCCLLCSPIKDGAALLFHNLPSNMLQVYSDTRHLCFTLHVDPCFPFRELICVKVTKQPFMTLPINFTMNLIWKTLKVAHTIVESNFF